MLRRVYYMMFDVLRYARGRGLGYILRVGWGEGIGW